jgi:hypothetical protein
MSRKVVSDSTFGPWCLNGHCGLVIGHCLTPGHWSLITGTSRRRRGSVFQSTSHCTSESTGQRSFHCLANSTGKCSANRTTNCTAKCMRHRSPHCTAKCSRNCSRHCTGKRSRHCSIQCSTQSTGHCRLQCILHCSGKGSRVGGLPFIPPMAELWSETTQPLHIDVFSLPWQRTSADHPTRPDYTTS